MVLFIIIHKTDETWDTMPDAKQATESHQHIRKSTLETKPDQAQVTNDTAKSDDQDRISEAPSTTPDDQHISREKDKVVEDTRLEMKQNNVPNLDRNTDECLESSGGTSADIPPEEEQKTLSQKVVTPNTQNLPTVGHEGTHEESQSELPLDKTDKTEDAVLSKEKLGEQGLVKEFGDLKVSTTDTGKDVTDKPSPVESESSSANKGTSKLLIMFVLKLPSFERIDR